MCRTCWFEYGAPILRTEEIDEAAELIRRLYEDLKQGTGGPLHAILDDMNINEESIGVHGDMNRYKKQIWSGTGWVLTDEIEYSQEVIDCCERIIELFADMTDGHRAAAIGWYEGWAQRQITEVQKLAIERP